MVIKIFNLERKRAEDYIQLVAITQELRAELREARYLIAWYEAHEEKAVRTKTPPPEKPRSRADFKTAREWWNHKYYLNRTDGKVRKRRSYYRLPKT